MPGKIIGYSDHVIYFPFKDLGRGYFKTGEDPHSVVSGGRECLALCLTSFSRSFWGNQSSHQATLDRGESHINTMKRNNIGGQVWGEVELEISLEVKVLYNSTENILCISLHDAKFEKFSKGFMNMHHIVSFEGI